MKIHYRLLQLFTYFCLAYVLDCAELSPAQMKKERKEEKREVREGGKERGKIRGRIWQIECLYNIIIITVTINI